MGEPTIEDQPVDDQPLSLTFEVVEGASKRGQQKLFDSRGYSYCIKRRRNAITYWHCSFRGKSNHCPASVIQRPEGFTVGVEHNHAGEVGLPDTAKLTAATKRKATDDLFRPASAIVDEVLLQGMETVAAMPTLARPEHLARAANLADSQDDHKIRSTLTSPWTSLVSRRDFFEQVSKPAENDI